MQSLCLILILLKSAVKSFFARIMPKLMFTSMTKINCTLEVAVQYMVQTAEWIRNTVQTAIKDSIPVTPLQFDICFAVGEPEMADDIPDDDDDDDYEDDDDDNDNYDDEDDQKYVDYVGDIESKLKNNKLKYSKKVVSVDEGLNGIFNDLYDPLVPKQNNKMQYFQSKRLISIVDRRHQDPKAKDDIFMFEPPINSRNIPDDAVPEWYWASSRLCLLPGLDVCSRNIPRTFLFVL